MIVGFLSVYYDAYWIQFLGAGTVFTGLSALIIGMAGKLTSKGKGLFVEYGGRTMRWLCSCTKWNSRGNDIANRMAVLNPHKKDKIAETSGVVLIDEIDLHSKWSGCEQTEPGNPLIAKMKTTLDFV